MSSLFDRLQNELEDRDKEGGITPLDMADLPPQLRKLMRLMLREVEMTRADLGKAVQSMPEADRLKDKELDQSLEALVKQSWLIASGEGDSIRYRVNLRRKKTVDLDSSIWNALENKIERKPSKGEDE
ncbi:MAG: hypothetical protein PVF83_13885 [Anaerolineales bacterium]|jgi:hypothetical protein